MAATSPRCSSRVPPGGATELPSYAAFGLETALATHWARARVTVTNQCTSASSDETPFVNTLAGGGELDMGEVSRAPLQASSSALTVKLWADLSSTYSGTCGSVPIEAIVARLHYNSAELDATTARVVAHFFLAGSRDVGARRRLRLGQRFLLLGDRLL